MTTPKAGSFMPPPPPPPLPSVPPATTGQRVVGIIIGAGANILAMPVTFFIGLMSYNWQQESFWPVWVWIGLVLASDVGAIVWARRRQREDIMVGAIVGLSVFGLFASWCGFGVLGFP